MDISIESQVLLLLPLILVCAKYNDECMNERLKCESPTHLALCKSDMLPTKTRDGSVPSMFNNFSLINFNFSNDARELME